VQTNRVWTAINDVFMVYAKRVSLWGNSLPVITYTLALRLHEVGIKETANSTAAMATARRGLKQQQAAATLA
ncbi:unnamed protein product, partial [Prorocentrum cordatum]